MRTLAYLRPILRTSLSSVSSSSLRPVSHAIRTFSALSSSSLANPTQQTSAIKHRPTVSAAFYSALPGLWTGIRSFSNGVGVSSNGPYSIVITLAGPDRPGIVRDLSKRLQELNANIEESRMTILGNDFAVILLINFPSSEVAPGAVKDSLQQLFPDFLVATRSTAAQRAIFASPHRIFTIHVQGPDQPGIVRNLTELLVTYNISVRDLDTDTSSAPFAGYKIFNLKAVIAVPTSVSFTSLHEGLKLFEEKYGFQVEIDDPTQPQQQGRDNNFAYEDESVDESEEDDEEEEEIPEEEEEEERYPSKGYKQEQQEKHYQQQKKHIPQAQVQQEQRNQPNQQGGKKYQQQERQQQQQQHDLNKTYKETVRAEKEKKQRK